MNRIAIVFTISILQVLILPSAAYALEISISGNAKSSENQVQAQTEATAAIDQSNNGQIDNAVESQANAGENSASSNTDQNGQIQTGSIDSSSTIINGDLNTNAAIQSCNCPNEQTVIGVTQNGSESTNITQLLTSLTTSVFQTNTATIINIITTNANTGKNSANDNDGNVEIRTGDIKETSSIENKNINNSQVFIPQNLGFLSMLVSGNGQNSLNSITLYFNKANSIFVNNQIFIENSLISDLNTGGNRANDNNGEVFINTGDIISFLTITNNDINTSKTTIDCCGEDKSGDPGEPQKQANPPAAGNPTETPKIQPTSQGTTSSGTSNGGDSKGETTLGEIAKGILPATGNSWLFFALVANALMFFMGWILRLRSGRSPGFVAA